jgi:hypothetical protein
MTRMIVVAGYVLVIVSATLVAAPISYVAFRALFGPPPIPVPSSDAQHLLERVLSLAAAPVPDFLFDVPMSGPSAPNARPALEELLAYALVTRDAHTGMYSVPQEVRDRTPRRRPSEALHWIDAAFRGDPREPRDRSHLDLLAPHAAAVTACAEDEGIASPTVDLMERLGMLLHAEGEDADAAALFHRAIAIAEPNFGKDHEVIEEIQRQLAVAEPPPGQHLDTGHRVFGRNVLRLAATLPARRPG